MDKIFKIFSGLSKNSIPLTQVTISIEKLIVADNSQVFIELSSNKNDAVPLDDSEKIIYTDDLEFLEINIYKNDYTKIGCKNLELLKKMYYYDIYSLINSKQIEFHTQVDLSFCRFQVLIKLVFSDNMKNKIKKQRLRPIITQEKWYSCFQVCRNCSEVGFK